MMRKGCKVRFGAQGWGTLILMLCLSAAAVAQDFLSPEALVADPAGKTLYVAAKSGKQVLYVDIASGKVVKSVSVPGSLTGLALNSVGDRLYVTDGLPQGKVVIVDLKTDAVAGEIAVGHTPGAPVLSSDGKTLYVANRFNNNVSVLDVENKKEVTRIGVPREPIAMALSPDGKTLVVANHLSDMAGDQDVVASKVTLIDTAANKVIKDLPLPNGSTGLRGACVSPDGKFAYVTHILARYQLPTTQLERGWICTNALSIVDLAKQELLNTVLLDDVDLGAANPWGVAMSGDGKFLCVAHAGTHEVSVIDVAGLHARLAKAAAGEKVSDASSSAADVPNDLAFLVGLRRRLKLDGNGPRGLVVVGSKACAAEYFSDTVGVVDVAPEARPECKAVELGPKKELTAIRRGERNFNDADFCFQKWLSCASCHPDGRADSLNWDLLNDGMGNPKSAKSMLYAHVTPPAMIKGIRPDAETAVRAGMKFTLFSIRPESESKDMDDYLKSLEPVPSPNLVNGKLSEAAERGKAVYEKAACNRCHTGDYLTDKRKYNIGTGIGMENGTEFDTPTLKEVWRTAPYLYDGRARTIKEVLTKYNKDDQHGLTSKLSEQELNDLAEYVLSL
jgi:YVTN family beta-propeller protein